MSNGQQHGRTHSDPLGHIANGVVFVIGAYTSHSFGFWNAVVIATVFITVFIFVPEEPITKLVGLIKHD